MSGEIVEKEILRLLAEPVTEKQAFDLLYKTYAKRLYWHIRNMLGNHTDTDDVLQNVLLKSWKGLKNFRGESKLSSWLFTIATNETISFINQQKKKALVSLDNDETNLSNTFAAEKDIDGPGLLLQLQKALDTLPDKQKRVFFMRYYDELSYQEISNKLGTSIGALKASYHHAVSKIEKFFNEHD